MWFEFILPAIYKPAIFGDEIVLRSIDWLENLPWRQENTVKAENDKFEICLQVKDFAPDEISVKISDGYIVVDAKHEERRDDYGYIARQFMRRYQIPEGCRADDIKSRLTAEGYLVITAPRQPVVRHDTVIPVKYEGLKPKSKL